MVVKHSVVREGPASFNVTISVFAWSDSGLSFIPLFSLLFHYVLCLALFFHILF